MTKCDYCGSTILFGGKRQGDLRFCNATCAQRGAVLAVSRQIPENVISQAVERIHAGLCPKCHGAGPVDVYVHHRVFSLIIITSWRSTPQISCRSCGFKSQMGDTILCLLLGWWGIPWGLVITPVQIVRNVAGMFHGPDPLKPSPRLEKAIRINVAAQFLAQQQAQKAAPVAAK